jgi:hypothetical protein
MANPRIPYRFSNDGPALKAAPQGAIMVHLVVNVEHWQFESSMPRTIITPPHGKETVPDVPNFSWADYGMRAGLPRILRAIQDRGLPASTSFNAGSSPPTRKRRKPCTMQAGSSLAMGCTRKA